MQTTLTRFERVDVPDERRFQYGRFGVDPMRWDMIGFGPSAISVLFNPALEWGIKWMNATTSAGYLDALRTRSHAAERVFEYEARVDRELLLLTRHLASLSIPRPLADSFDHEVPVLLEAGLLDAPSAETLAPTPRGMFFADSIAGLLAGRRLAWIRRNVAHGVDCRLHVG